MSLVRCPGCKLDTSDSLAHWPSCGAVLHGSGPPLFEQPAAEPRVEPTPSASQAQSPGVSTQAKAIAWVIVIVVLALVPFLIPFAVMAVVFWLVSKSRRSGQQTKQMEALKILVTE